MGRVRQNLNPHYDEAHNIVNKIAAKSKLWRNEIVLLLLL
jgi:hypothetical protein